MSDLAREKVNDILEDIRDGLVGSGGTSLIEELTDAVQTPVDADTLTVGSAASATTGWSTWTGGRGVITVGGTFGGTTVTMQARMNSGADAVSMGPDAIFTAAGGCGFELPVGAEIRASMSGGSGISLNILAAKTGI